MSASHARNRATVCTLWLCLALAGCSAVNDYDFKFTLGVGDAGDAMDGDVEDEDGSVTPPDAGTADAMCPEHETVCNDDVDEDCDGLRDCRDPDCTDALACCKPSEIPEVSCNDKNIDEDCDGKADCQDDNCRQAVFCCPNPVPETTEATCTDGQDNDCDGKVDCAQESCAKLDYCSCVLANPGMMSAPETGATCGDMVDNDCDKKPDCADKDCFGADLCCTQRVGGESTCTGGLDEDCDMLIDCADPDCRKPGSPCACANAPAHENAGCTGITCLACDANTGDEDCDGNANCDDDDCKGALAQCCKPTAGQERGETACNDAVDNDCDGLPDCQDSECRNNACCAPVVENTEALCSDGVDNDCARGADCGDDNCTSSVYCCRQRLDKLGVPYMRSETGDYCGDGYDNDCDGDVDMKDKQCLLECEGVLKGAGLTVVAETGSKLCADKYDNDCDGRKDCSDSGCFKSCIVIGPLGGGIEASQGFVPGLAP